MLDLVQNECQLILLVEFCSLHRVSSFYSHICTVFYPSEQESDPHHLGSKNNGNVVLAMNNGNVEEQW